MKNLRILICDDDESMAMMIARVLKRNNAGVAVLSQMDKLIPRVQAFEPDLILMDICMPGISGIDAAKILSENSSTKHIPVIFLSGDPKVEQYAQQLNKLYIEKPFNIDKLQSIVNLYALNYHDSSEYEEL